MRRRVLDWADQGRSLDDEGGYSSTFADTRSDQESRSATMSSGLAFVRKDWHHALPPIVGRKPENAREECQKRIRWLQRRGACRDEGARRRAARRRQKGRQEGRRFAGGPGQDRGDGTGGSCAR